MTSFQKLQRRQAQIKARLVEFSGLEPNLVENILQYAKNLVQPETQEISDNVFMSQMMNRFGITSQIMVNHMFEVLQRRVKLYGKDSMVKRRSVPLEDYCWCICIFLTSNLDHKINWAFSVYDANDDGILSKMEIYILLKPCVLHSEEMDTEEAIKELIEIVMAVVDINRNNAVDRDEFRELVKKNVLYIDLLGQCLPSERAVKWFLRKVSNKTPMEVAKMFEEERDNGLMQPMMSAEDDLYPIHLDLP